MHWEMQKKEKRKQENLTAIVTSRYHSWKTILGAQKTLKSKKSNILEFFRVLLWREWKCQDQVKFKRFNQYIKATRLLAKQKISCNGIYPSRAFILNVLEYFCSTRLSSLYGGY